MDWQGMMETYGYLGVVVAIIMPFLPSEVPLAYAGYLVHKTELSLALMVMLALLTFIVTQNIFFSIGRFGSDRALRWLFRTFRISEARMHQFKSNMDSKGKYILLFSPLWRMGFAIGAGLTGVSRAAFTLATALSFFAWSLFFIWTGKLLGARWHVIVEGPSREWIAVLLIGVVLVFVWIRWRRKKMRNN